MDRDFDHGFDLLFAALRDHRREWLRPCGCLLGFGPLAATRADRGRGGSAMKLRITSPASSDATHGSRSFSGTPAKSRLESGVKGFMPADNVNRYSPPATPDPEGRLGGMLEL